MHYHSAFLFPSAPLTTSVCVTETIRMSVPLIIIPLCSYICVLHVVCVYVCVKGTGACDGNNYECALPTFVLTESDVRVDKY
jgi:hypothetical protein